jgi:hypothetical protein
MSKESREIIKPFVTHRNATASVIWVFRVLRIEAALLDLAPGLIFRGLAATVRGIVFEFVAAAAFRKSTLEIRSEDAANIAAVASTFPDDLTGSSLKNTQNDEPFKSLAGEVFQITVRFGRFLCSHDALLKALWLEPRRVLVTLTRLAYFNTKCAVQY